MDYLTVALILIGVGALLLLAEVLVPTGGILVVGALLCFAAAVGTILYYGTATEAVVAMVGLAVGLPAAGYAAVAAWRRMSLDSALDEPAAAPAAAPPELEALKGRAGKTVSPMRPSGTVEFDGRRVDAMTEGMPLEPGVWVRCVDVRRGLVIVREMEDQPDLTGIDPYAAPPAESPAPPPATPPRPKDDSDDFDIGLDRT
jgi:membrane-bound serine protease (ClpP class)